jgi:molybdenum cofactor cytidylyltransferase
MRIVGILLAAGAGARFGGAKLLSPLPATSHGVTAGTPLGAAAAMHMVAALNEVIAVVRPGDTVLAHSLECTGARIVVCERAAEGMGVSLACGVLASFDAGGWIIALGDMPWIAPPTIVAVADAIKAGAELAAPSYRGQRGHPVGFARAYGALLSSLTGDEGARTVVAAHQSALQLVDVDDPGAIRDVDLPHDLR